MPVIPKGKTLPIGNAQKKFPSPPSPETQPDFFHTGM